VDHEKSVVAMTKQLSITYRHTSRKLRAPPIRGCPLKPGIVAIEAQDIARASAPASDQGPTDFVRRPSAANARRHHGAHKPCISLPVATAQRIGYRFGARRIGSESSFERIGDWLLGLESSNLPRRTRIRPKRPT
jgi:hypothetical protein